MRWLKRRNDQVIKMEFKHRAVLVHNLIYFPFSPSSPPPTSQIEGVQTVRLNPVPDGQVLPEELTVFPPDLRPISVTRQLFSFSLLQLFLFFVAAVH